MSAAYSVAASGSTGPVWTFQILLDQASPAVVLQLRAIIAYSGTFWRITAMGAGGTTETPEKWDPASGGAAFAAKANAGTPTKNTDDACFAWFGNLGAPHILVFDTALGMLVRSNTGQRGIAHYNDLTTGFPSHTIIWQEN